MTKLFTIIFLLFLSSCHDDNPSQSFLPPNKKDINQIVETVIYRDSLQFLKESKRITADSNMVPISVDLRKLRVIVTDTTTNVPPPVDLSSVSVFSLFNIAVDGQRFFNAADSSYFFFQNDTLRNIAIYSELTNKIVTTTLSEEQQKHNSNQFMHYYDLTIPIFSVDNKKAYIELTSNCSGCGGATSYYLEKINSKWTIVGWQRRWMN